MGWARTGFFLITVLMVYPIAGWGQGAAASAEWVVSDGGGVEAGGHVNLKGLPAEVFFGGTYTATLSFTVEWFDWGSSIRPQSIEWYAKAGCIEEVSGVCVRNSQNITLGSSTIDGSFTKNQTFSVTASLSLKNQPAVNGTLAALGVRIAALIECLDSTLCSPIGAVNPAQKFTFLRPESSVSFTIFSTSIPTNIIKNSGFEEGLDPVTGYPLDWLNWTKHGGPSCSATTACVSLDNTRFVNGSTSAKLDLGQLNIGFVSIAQMLPSDLTFGKLSDSPYGLDVWFYYLPKYAGTGDFRIRVLYAEYAGELDYIFDPDPGLGYPNSTSTVTLADGTAVPSGTKNIFVYGYQQGQWNHFHTNLRADWAAPLYISNATFQGFVRGFSLDIPFPRIQFDAIGWRTGDSYYSETLWVDEVKLYENIGPPVPAPDFSISANPDSLTIHHGSSSTSTVTVRSLNGFSGLIHLTADIAVESNPGITAFFDQPVLLLTPSGTNTTVLSVLVSNSTLSGSFPIVVGGNALHWTRVLVEVPGATQLVQHGPWSLEWQLTDNDGVAIRNVSYSGISVVEDARLPGILSTYSNNYCGPFYEESIGSRIDPSQILVENLTSGGFQIRAPYNAPGENFQQIWRFQPDGSFQGLLTIGNSGCFPAHLYEARWHYSFSLSPSDTLLRYDGSAWGRVTGESVLVDSGSRDSSHNNTVWAVTGGGRSVFFTPSDEEVPTVPGTVLAVVDRPGEVERTHIASETPLAFLNNESLVGSDAAFWYVSTHSVGSFDTRPPNLAVLTGLNFYIRTPSDLTPVASFTVSPRCASPGQALVFDATSSYDPDGAIIGYHWDFGDGTSADGAVATHTYATFGSFTVTLTVQDNSTPAQVALRQLAVVAGNCLLSADFSITPAIIAFTPVTFNATVAGGATPYTFSWDFGDGFSGAGNPVVHAYANSCGGTLQVVLLVTDSNGVVVVVTKTVNIIGETLLSSVDFYNIPAVPISGEQTIFLALVSGGSPPYTFNWDFGDGQGITGLTGASAVHSYPLSQVRTVYNVALSVIDACHLENTAVHALTVQPGNAVPVAAFTYSPTLPRAEQVVGFNGSSSFDLDGTITSWEWSFGDVFCIPGPCPVDSGPLVHHVYSSPGNYTITLIVTDNLGARASTSLSINVLPAFDHDVSVDTIRVEQTIAIQGQHVGILLALRNLGVHNETARLVVSWDASPITDRTIGLPAFSSDPFGGFISVEWDTSGVPPGNHTISATVYLASDQDLSNNSLTDGTVTILPPPTITLTPSSGTLATKVVVAGTGFPISAYPPYGSPAQVIISFDDQFIGIAVPRNGSFTFTFNIPHAKQGTHQVKALDTNSLLKAAASLEILETPAVPELVVTLDGGLIYFPGDTATIYIHATVNGVPSSPETLELLLLQPDGTTVMLNATLVEPGLYRAVFQVPPTGSIGTYAVIATAHQGSRASSSLASFEVKPSWITVQGPRIAGAAAAIGGIAIASAAWRRGYFRRKNESE